MELYFLRHSEALTAEDADVETDDERPLSPEGEETAKIMADAFGRLHLSFGAILASPLVRTRQMAEIIAQEMGAIERLSVVDELAPGFSLPGLRRVLQRDARDRLLMIGHEPDLSTTISALIGGGELDIGKATLVRVDLDAPTAPRGRLKWIVTPDVIRTLSESVGEEEDD